MHLPFNCWRSLLTFFHNTAASFFYLLICPNALVKYMFYGKITVPSKKSFIYLLRQKNNQIFVSVLYSVTYIKSLGSGWKKNFSLSPVVLLIHVKTSHQIMLFFINKKRWCDKVSSSTPWWLAKRYLDFNINLLSPSPTPS